MIYFILVLAGLAPMMAALVLMRRQHNKPRADASRKLVFGVSVINIVVACLFVGIGLVWLFAPGTAEAASLSQAATVDPYQSLAAAIAVSFGSIAAGYAVSTTGSAAIGAIAEKPETFGRALIFVGLSEGVAIYGLIIAFIILNR
jgi:V/A-type H+-transporting ATPase subunit K